MLSQCLHGRHLHLKHEVQAFAAQIVSDLYNKQIIPHPLAYPAILEILATLDNGAALENLWAWLLQQDDEHLSPQAYGAIIAIAVDAGKPLRVMEDLYEQALKRFPGDYAAYHMSPNAIIQHRGQVMSIKGSSGHLLGAIARARFVRGHRRRAYLDLDTALRLRPDQLARDFCSEFMLATTPLEERYILFQLNCRNHTLLVRSIFASVLEDLDSQAFMGAPGREVAVASRQVELLSAAIGTGRKWGSRLLQRCCQLALRLTVLARASGSRLDVLPGTISILDKIFDSAVACPGTIHFNSVKGIIATAGQLRSRGLFEAGLRYYGTAAKMDADVVRDPIMYCSIIKTAGLLDEPNVVKSAWEDLLELQRVEPQKKSDWIVLARACRETDMADFVHAELSTAKIPEDSAIWSAAWRELDRPRKRSKPLDNDDIAAAITSSDLELGELVRKLDEACELLQTGGTRNFKQSPARMLLGEPHIQAHEADMHAVYDYLTADPREIVSVDDGGASDSMTSSSSPILSSGYRLDELRYENWKTINELLAQSALHDGDSLDGLSSLFDSVEPLSERELLKLLVKLRGIDEGELRARAGRRIVSAGTAVSEPASMAA